MKTLVTIASWAILALPALGGAASSLAASLVEASGVTGGLIVHLGCGNGRLTAALSSVASGDLACFQGSHQAVREGPPGFFRLPHDTSHRLQDFGAGQDVSLGGEVLSGPLSGPLSGLTPGVLGCASCCTHHTYLPAVGSLIPG